jgi:propionyl-CoA synthetase
VHIMSRSDDIINVSAHRLSTGSIEEVLASHISVAECCVVGMPDSQKGTSSIIQTKADVGHVPLAFITATHIMPSNSLFAELNSLVRKQIGGIASLAGVVVLEKIPKTRSGKTLRRVLREIVEKGISGDWQTALAVPATVEDRSYVDWARERARSWMARRMSGQVKPRL